jgi:hypothetical protein
MSSYKLSKDSGAVSLNLSVLLRHTASVIRSEGDSLSGLSNDRTKGVLIENNPDDPEQAYEVVVWGDRWSLLALACDQTSHRRRLAASHRVRADELAIKGWSCRRESVADIHLDSGICGIDLLHLC